MLLRYPILLMDYFYLTSACSVEIMLTSQRHNTNGTFNLTNIRNELCLIVLS